MTNLKESISKITSVAEYNLQSMIEKSNLIIAHAVTEAMLEHNDLVEVDIGIGILIIHKDGQDIIYKFIPSAKLKSAVNYCIEYNESPLAMELDTSLGDRINTTYKELF